MKISFECECILLQKTLLMFCKDFIAEHKDCDFVVSDRKIATQKPLFLIGSHINLPFTKQNLLNLLEEFYSAIQIKPSVQENLEKDSLEKEVLALIEEFKKDVISLIRSRS
ncbi:MULTISPECIES: ornithine carbamoyltransferase [unclassified Campylobacter]|uniref:ornithine carbamoyltransferase n=1 Tax=unclassified Campylobacter TaxID=2593542 RepID=UPI0014756D1E|nr:ornithine carbamoyltransferase [Campylobacter sp. RM9328]MBE3022681.1 ornithine carbamoyltransferase [Campylobacter sp. 7477a]